MRIELKRGVNGVGRKGETADVGRGLAKELIAQNRAILVPREQKAVIEAKAEPKPEKKTTRKKK